MKVKKISEYPKEKRLIIFSIATSIINALVLIFSISTLHFAMQGDFGLIRLFLSLSYFFLGVTMANLAFFDKEFKANKIAHIKHIVFAAIYAIIALLFAVIPMNSVQVIILSGLYMLSIVANRVCRILEKKKAFNIVFNIFLALIAFVLSIIIFASIAEELMIPIIMLTCIFILSVSLIELLLFALSRIKINALIRIMRKTYALEILYGLFILIISFSFVFLIFEESIVNYGDALWYCFAVVTTIGFGDYYAVGALGRVLTVILGIYGIIVVASITSVIVNFYNEVKDHPEEDDTLIEEIDSSDKDEKEKNDN